MSIFGRRRIYLDHASTTPVSPAVLRAMHAAEGITGNPSSIHGEGVKAKRALEAARARVASELGCKAREAVFTSGITESNNLAILGFARKLELAGSGVRGTHWIVSSIEHASVLECFAEVERLGGDVSYADPDARGIITPVSVSRLLRTETVFVSIGWANNEIGVVQPLSAIAEAIRAHEERHRTKVIIHSDAGQAPLYRSPQVHTLGVDLLSLGGVKLYGPHGAGALFVGARAELAPVVLGGGQERGLRAGTENVALAAGFAEALAEAARLRAAETKRIAKLRDTLAKMLLAEIPGMVINGDLKHALPHMLNVSVPFIWSEYFVLALDRAGIAVSTKSACNEAMPAGRQGDASRSHVVLRLAEAAAEGGEPPVWRSEHTLRFSLGRGTSARDIGKTCDEVGAIIRRLKSD